MMIRFSKYHALGNDYLVLNPLDVRDSLTPAQIRRICDRRRGVGADGILLGPQPAPAAEFGLRIFNPDGSQAEKSGNGLRIFARYLWDLDRVQEQPFTISTPGGTVTAQVKAGGRQVTVDMGRVSFDSQQIPVVGPRREVIEETMLVGGEELRYCAATVGNPHCIILREKVSPADAQRLGPLVERLTRFPHRTNVQFIQVLDRSTIQIEIWERGAGYTLASGSSSCAAAAVAYRLGLCDSAMVVTMPGGKIDIKIAADWTVTMTGPVTSICHGRLVDEMFE